MGTRKKARGGGQGPRVLPGSPVKLFAGLIARTPQSGLVANDICRKLLGATTGEYYVVRSEQHSTQIVRQLVNIPTSSDTRPDFIYMDAGSLRLLSADVGDPVFVSKSDFDLDVP